MACQRGVGMGDEMAVSRAEADLARLQIDIARLRAQLSEAEERATKVRHYIEMARLYEAGEDAVPPITRARTGNVAHISDASADMLRNQDAPMQTRAIVDALAKLGINVPGANPINYLSGVLSRSESFAHDRLLGWHLREWRRGIQPLKIETDGPEVAPDDLPHVPDEIERLIRTAAE